jgi:hypothetical protein
MKIIGILVSTVFLTTSAVAQDTAVIDQARTALEKGIAETQTGRESTTLVNVDGVWLVANFHFSPIF